MKTVKRTEMMAALYLRLSRDDEGEEESASIKNQRKLLRAYCAEQGYFVYGEYVDDGYSGTSFDRPAFRRMIADIEAGLVNLVITKDLSRLGRDYITAGEYTERFFPEHGVRYIALNDGYDSDSPYTDIAPFKNIINEMYARDASKKIRSAFETKMREGSYIGNFAPYGYEKDPLNRNHLVVDYEAAPVVQEIFRRLRGGERLSEVARDLNRRGVESPIVYRCRKHGLDAGKYSGRGEWTSQSIYKMVRNMVYLGHTAQGKTTKVSFKSDKMIRNGQEDWYTVRGTHEPLIDKETFEIVTRQCCRRRCEHRTDFQNIFSGVARCADCGRNMSITGSRSRDERYNLVCGQYKLRGSGACSNHFIGYNVLYHAVLEDIRRQIRLSREDREAIAAALAEPEQQGGPDAERRTRAAAELQRRHAEIDRLLMKLYEDNADGKISDDRYAKMTAAYESEQAELAGKLEAVERSAPEKCPRGGDRRERLYALLDSVTEVRELTRELVFKLIDHIEVEQGCFEETEHGREKRQTIRIFYRFAGPEAGQAG